MDQEEEKIQNNAFEYIKQNAQEVINRFASPSECHSVENPVSLFMAGSPGAGKTEVSKSLVKRFEDRPIRIDADEIRPLCPEYTGTNAHLFQKAANKGVNILYDHALKNSCNCIMDGTFAYGDAEMNIERSLKRKRRVEIWFVYQDPIKAWEFTKAREQHEARHVSREVFAHAYCEARLNVKRVKERFGKEVVINLLAKDYVVSTEELYLNVGVVDLDGKIDSRYSEESLKEILV